LDNTKEAYTIPTGTPDLGDMGAFPWGKIITQSNAPNILRLAEEIVKAKDSGPYSFRIGYVASITLTNPPVISAFMDGIAAGQVQGIRLLSGVSVTANQPALILVMPGGMMVCLGGLSMSDWQTIQAQIGPAGSGSGVNGTNTSRWRYIDGNTVEYHGYFEVTNGVTSWPNGILVLTLPVAAGASTTPYQPIGWATAYKSSTATEFTATVILPGAGTGANFIGPAYAVSSHQYWAQSSPTAPPWNGVWAVSTDSIKWHVRYGIT
jgi:hypothetical protein